MSRFSIVGPMHPLRGGIAQHTTGIVREARARSHEVRVLSYRRQYPDVLFPGRTQFDTEPAPAEALVDVDAAIDSIDPRTWFGTASRIAEFGADLVLFQRWHPFFSPALATIAGRVRGRARIAWMVHNARPHEGGVPWGPLLRVGYRAEDVCFVHAAAEDEALRALGVRSQVRHVRMPSPGQVRRVGAEDARRRLGLGAEEVVFLFFGHVRPYKGVDVLVRALEKLAGEGAPWRAIIAGEWYMDPAAIRAQIDGAGLADRVEILDQFLPQDRVDDVFAAATVVALPYVAGTQSAVVPLAYAYGRPVVTTRVGGLPEIVEDGATGRLVEPGDADGLAEALEEVRRGERFSGAAIAEADSRASFGALVDELEAIVSAPVFP